MDCLLIADDLTGACDAAAQFAVQGLPTSVLLEADVDSLGARVIAVSTDSRHLDEAEARAEVERVSASFPASSVVFKKIDSVLRGNPGAEIAAAMRAFGCGAAVATPAYPVLGRMVEGGRVSIGALDVAASLRSDVHVSAGAVAEALEAGARVVSADAACDADLDRIVAGGVVSGRRILWAGSAGLAGAIARRWAKHSLTVVAPHADVAFCIGSDHRVTVRQVERLREERPDCQVVRVDSIPAAVQAILLSGGDTAAYVCRAAGARRIDLCGEVLPGIPWGYLRCGRFDGIPVITKSGGFGAPDALIRIAEFFQ